MAEASPSAKPAFDLVVYGGTASGVMTAYSASRQGLHVVLLEPTHHLGGMVTGGLSATDHGYSPIIGGYTREFYREAASTYGTTNLEHSSDWFSEPKVGEAIFQHWLAVAHVDVRFGERVKERGGVEIHNGTLTALVTEDGRRWTGKEFADCSYEGDVMAQAHITYVVGREGASEFGESLAGVRTETPKHQFLWKISAYDDHHKLLPEIDPGPLGPQGSADKKVQSYNFRLILTDDPTNRMPWSRPAGYDASRFALLKRYLQSYKEHTGKEPTLKTVTNPVCFAHHKCDFNNNGPFSTDYLGKSWAYPDAGYKERARIWHDHMLYTQSFFYFLATDPSVPKSLQDDVNRWGRAKDEFTDTDGWPRQLYIREGRRMRGMYVMRQSDLQTDRTKPDSIAMGSYNSDSHNVQRVAMPDGSVFNEGDVQVHVEPYEISYRAILPKPEEAKNLLVPVCLSATHVAYSSVRMEPQYMMIGEAAGVAAALAIKENVPIQKISLPNLQAILRSHGTILHLDQQVRSTSSSGH
ncbi:MAG TPA: FAD-dependent oxidoreductase [Edaphobacter sp.]|nr:FAD-dependent oxidoreductase [Edaphobacter sp.]